MSIPEDPFDAGFEVTDGLANLLVGGFIPLGFTGTGALIFHSHLLKNDITSYTTQGKNIEYTDRPHTIYTVCMF